MIIVSNQSIEMRLWEGLLMNNLQVTPFQLPNYYRLYNSIDDLSADVFAIQIENEYIALVIVTIQKETGIKSYFSKRGIIYGGPIVKTGYEKYLSFLLIRISEYYKSKLIYLEVRNYQNNSDFHTIYLANGWDFEKRLNVHLQIQGKSVVDILAEMKYNRRREIGQSVKEGAIVKLAQNESDIIRLYTILSDLYKKRVKVPLPNLDFFLKLFKSEMGKVFVVIHDNQIIGGSFNIFSSGLTINTLYYCGIRDYHKKIFPTHMAIMGVIEFAVNNNLKWVDFMGAGKPNEEYGVRDYKMQFGGELIENSRYLKILNPILYRIGKIGIKVLSKLN